MAALELIRPACLVRLTDQKSLFLLGVDLYSPSAESLVRYLWYILYIFGALYDILATLCGELKPHNRPLQRKATTSMLTFTILVHV